MVPANIIIRDFCVDQGGIQLGMTQEPLNLLHGHSVLKQDSGDGMTENMRRNANREAITGTSGDLVNRFLYGFRIQRLIGRTTGAGENERRSIRTRCKVGTKGNLCGGIQKCFPCHVSLPLTDDDGMPVPINIRNFSVTDFGNSGSG